MKKNSTRLLTKLGITAAAVVGIGWGFIALNPPDDKGTPTIGVQETNADIFTTTFAEPTNTQKFTEALDRLGHEKPRTYDYNGNTVFFSTNFVRKAPPEVLREYQLEFVNQGVNPEVFSLDNLTSERRARMEDASLEGGIIPWEVSNGHFTMGGTILDNKVDPDNLGEELTTELGQLEGIIEEFHDAYRGCGGSEEDWKQAMRGPQDPATAKLDAPKAKEAMCSGGGGSCSETRERLQDVKKERDAIQLVLANKPELRDCRPMKDVLQMFSGLAADQFTRKIKAYRSLEAYYDPEAGVTAVTASWSDENFDARKAHPSRYGIVVDSAAAKLVPTCPGCTRPFAFKGTGTERDYASNTLVSRDSIDRVAEFYLRTMGENGWEIPESQVVVEEMENMAGGPPDPNSTWLRFRKGRSFLLMQIYRKDGRTHIVTTNAN